MQAMLEAIEDGLVPPEQYLPELREQTRLLGILVNDLFELARIDAGALTLEICEASLARDLRFVGEDDLARRGEA